MCCTKATFHLSPPHMAESHRTQPSRRQPSCACRVTPRSRVKRRDPVSVPSGLISPSAVAEGRAPAAAATTTPLHRFATNHLRWFLIVRFYFLYKRISFSMVVMNL
ncbi:hypothetical protein AAZV13_01G086300 [Glycine max]